MRALLFLIIFWSFSISVEAQKLCGNIDSNNPYSQKHIPNFIPNQKGQVSNVAISFHIVSPRELDNTVPTAELENEIDAINRFFEGAGIQFFMCGSQRFIKGDITYSYAAGDRLNATKNVPNTINVFLMDEVTTNDGDPLCGYASFPWSGGPRQRYIAIAKDCLGQGKTLAHELGHFYGLAHTHASFNGRELVNGSNCQTAGDGFCDTPADPTLGFNNVFNCAFVGDERDPNNKEYNPDVTNIMSYAPDQCLRTFSGEQNSFVNFISENDNRYLKNECNGIPDFEVTSDFQTLTSRADQQINAQFTFSNIGLVTNREVEVYFYLSEKQTTLGQLVFVDTLLMEPSMGSFQKEFTLTIPLNTSSKSYYITARLDPNYKIFETTEDNNVSSIRLKVDNSTLSDQLLYPNPVIDRARLFVRDNTFNEEINIAIYNMSGQLVKRFAEQKIGSEFFVDLDLSELNPGLYIIETQYEEIKNNNSFKFIKEN